MKCKHKFPRMCGYITSESKCIKCDEKYKNMDLYKHECGLYVRDGEPWQIQKYGHNHLSKGDIIYNTMRKIVDDDDRSVWAVNALKITRDLLKQGKRWPDSLRHYYDARNFIGWKWSVFVCWQEKLLLGGDWIVVEEYRPQGNITRDPYIYFFMACVTLDKKHMIYNVNIPWYLFSPATWGWVYYLKTGRGLSLYEIFEKPVNKRDYVKRLEHYRRMAVEKINI